MKAIKFLLIIGTCLGLEASTPQPDEKTIYWSPDKALVDNGKIKRDHNGDRI